MLWKNNRVLFLILGMAVFLAGCDRAAVMSTEPAPLELSYETALVSFTEPQGEVKEAKNGWATEYGGITYCFAQAIEETDRNAVVNETVAILGAIENKVGTVQGEFTLCMREDYYLPRVQDRTLYIGFENFRTQEYAVGIAQMLFGNGMPYGLEYALGTDVARRLGYSVEPVAELKEALDLCDTVPIYLDLNYACFLDAYADTETLSKVKALAFGFYEHLIQSGNTDLYTAFSPEKYRACLNDFLAVNGKGEYDNSDLDGIALYNGGSNIRLVWENSDGIFYVMEDYTSKYVGDDYGEDMVNSGYGNLRRIIVDSIPQAAYMREKLKDFDILPEPVPVLFTRDSMYDYYSGAVYLPLEQEIHIYWATTEPFMHEYCHYLLRDYEYGWFQEAIASYYQYDPVDEQITPSWYNEMKRCESLDPNDPEEAEEYLILRAVEDHLGREIDWYSMDDYIYQLNAYLVKMDRPLGAVTDITSGAGVKISFFHYLVGLQGEQGALEAVIYNAPDRIFESSWTGLIRDWQTYMVEEFAWTKDIVVGE